MPRAMVDLNKPVTAEDWRKTEILDITSPLGDKKVFEPTKG